ncbi:unnamed protein product [Orchesella dallaii]|uniref:Peptidase S1 domain-containing protein n=1 Tax=Orchesella dallaii TaxID=48710 RepID=A0ABP1RQ13_9HEXA
MNTILILALTALLTFINTTEAIIGGQNAEKNQFPWHVRFNVTGLENRASFCSGSLIDLDLVLTSASCVVDQNRPITIVAGDHLILENDGTEQTGTSQNIFVHEEFNRTSKQHDIALIRLASKFEDTTAVKPIGLPPQDLYPEYQGDGIAAGWGETVVSEEVGNLSSVLLKTNVIVGDRTVCKALASQLPDEQFCSMGEKGGYRGDFGGPLLCGNETNGVCGILSAMTNGSINTLYRGYVEVSRYLEWIEEHKNILISTTTTSQETETSSSSTVASSPGSSSTSPSSSPSTSPSVSTPTSPSSQTEEDSTSTASPTKKPSFLLPIILLTICKLFAYSSDNSNGAMLL